MNAVMTDDPYREARLANLQRANAVRMARVQLRNRVRAGEITVQDVLADVPTEARTMAIFELLTSQRRWGQARARKFLHRHQISELRHVGDLTDRQRRVLLVQVPLEREATALRRDDA